MKVDLKTVVRGDRRLSCSQFVHINCPRNGASFAVSGTFEVHRVIATIVGESPERTVDGDDPGNSFNELSEVCTGWGG